MKIVYIWNFDGNKNAEKETNEILGHQQFTFSMSSSWKTVFRHKHLVIVEQNNFNLGSVIFEVLVIYPPSSISKVYVFLDKAI